MRHLLSKHLTLLWTPKNRAQTTLFFLLAIVLGVFLIETYKYPGFVTRYFQVKVWWFMAGFLVLNTGIRAMLKTWISGQLYRALWWSVAGVLLFTYVVRTLTLFYPNLLFQTLHLHPEPFQLLGLFGLGLTLVNFDWPTIKKYWKEAVFVLPIYIVVGSALIKWHYEHEVFNKLKREDGLFEYITFFAFAGGSALAARAWFKTRSLALPKLIKRGLMTFFLALALVSGVIAGEEISWGQRIIGFETPEQIAARNTQDELTLHNDHDIINLVYRAYFALSLYSVLAWLVVLGLQQSPKTKQLARYAQLITPGWYLSGFFVPTLIYVYLRETYGYISYGSWEEFTEMVQALGIFGFILVTSLQFPTYFQSPKPTKTKRTR